jgi:leader peptidase (prepilin peptidase)/N-methyltransferase
VWAVRILGTLAFGREAMGMGDVHLLAAVGAVIGWRDPIFIFFLAAFIGLAWVALCAILSAFRVRIQRELPYGPHLAAATLAIMLLHPFLYGASMGAPFWPKIQQAWDAAIPIFP